MKTLNRRLVSFVVLALFAVIGLPLLSAAAQTPEPLRLLKPKIVSVRPHDPAAYTQGLLLHDGFFYESTGLEGQSTLRKVDPLTGEVLQRTDLPPNLFGEGLALVDDRFIQITWKSQVALVYDRETFKPLDTFTYIGEGWGLCYDGESLYMSNGSSALTRRDPKTFKELEVISVTLEGQPVTNLNELECVGGSVYANVWFTNQIMEIDKRTGRIKTIIDAAGLLTPEETAAAGYWGTMNGIAYDAETGRFFLTGKFWPWVFEVELVTFLDPSYKTPTPLPPAKK